MGDGLQRHRQGSGLGSGWAVVVGERDEHIGRRVWRTERHDLEEVKGASRGRLGALGHERWGHRGLREGER